MKKSTLLMAIAISLLLTPPVLAFDIVPDIGTRSTEQYGYFRADSLVGKTILSDEGQVMGEVENVIIRPDGEAQIMLSRGGIFDIGEQYRIIPWSAVKNVSRQNVRLSLSSDQVLNSPTFMKETLRPGWESQVNSYYGGGTSRPLVPRRPCP